jgi:hypothetical protein
MCTMRRNEWSRGFTFFFPLGPLIASEGGSPIPGCAGRHVLVRRPFDLYEFVNYSFNSGAVFCSFLFCKPTKANRS